MCNRVMGDVLAGRQSASRRLRTQADCGYRDGEPPSEWSIRLHLNRLENLERQNPHDLEPRRTAGRAV